MKTLKRTLALTLVLCMLCSFLPVSAFAAEAPTTNLSTTGSPFQKGTGESNSFRIPAMVTLSDGALVAAADARWNTTFDGGGLDTMVAISDDDGATWTHSFANYLGDNGNQYNGGGSSCFIDPALAVDANDAIYMLCDLYPYGIALNGSGNTAPATAVGFNDADKLLLSADNHASYGYYLDGDVIKDNNGSAVAGLTVDEYFNVTGTYNGVAVDSNLFFADSPFKVVRTGFLYLTKGTYNSDDKTISWSAPQLLNVKTNSEMVCLVGPGRGLVTSDGTIVFPVYSYNGGVQRMGFISSTDGSTWQRSANLDYDWASESAPVELNETTMRFFFRNGTKQLMYVDYNRETSRWSAPRTTGQYVNSNTQISAIALKQQVNGRKAILVSCPAGNTPSGSDQSGASYRTNGKIFLYTLDDRNNMTKKSEVSVPSVHSAYSFMYSCMTMLLDENGNESDKVAILYEDQENEWGTGDNCYYQMSYKIFSLKDDFGVTEDGKIVEDVTVTVGKTETYTIAGEALNGFYEDEYAKVEWVSGADELTAVTLPTTAGSSVEAYISDGNGNFLSFNGDSLVNETDIQYATKWTITCVDAQGNGVYRYTVKDGNYKVQLDNGGLTFTQGSSSVNHLYTAERGFYGSSNGSNVWGYDADTDVWDVDVSGSSAKPYSANTKVTITGKAKGSTEVEVGSVTYGIEVEEIKRDIVDVTLKVGETYNGTIYNFNYEDAEDNSYPNEKIAGLSVDGTDAVYSKGTFAKPADLKAGTFTGKYIIKNSQSGKLITNVPDNGGLHLDGSDTSFGESALWKITHSGDSGFTVQDIKDKYMNIGNNSATLLDAPKTLTYTYNEGSWKYVLADGSYKLNQYGGTSSTRVAGWDGEDDGSRFEIYQVNETPASTAVTIEGVSRGKTVAIVGNTQYNITVTSDPTKTVDVLFGVDKTYTVTDDTGDYTDDATAPDAAYANMELELGTSNLNPVTEIESGKQYLIVNNETGDVLSNSVIVLPSNSLDWGSKTALASSEKPSTDSAELWTITATNSGYTVVQDGKYLSFGGYYANMTDTVTNLTLNYTNSGWTFYDDETLHNINEGLDNSGYYLNDNVGDGYSGGALGSATVTASSYWTVYEIVPSTEITFTGVAPGTTTAVVGDTSYNITVMNTVDVLLDIDEEKTFNDETGNYVNNVVKEPDTSIAEMSVEGVDGNPDITVSTTKATELEPNATYIIRYKDSNQAMTSNQGGTRWGTSDGYPRAFEAYSGPEADNMWTLEPSGNGYKLKSAAGYLVLGNNSAELSADGGDVFTLIADDNGWKISDDQYDIDALGGLTSYYCAGGYRPSGTRFDLYKVTTAVPSTTAITFKGVSKGETTAAVGNTMYYITVVDLSERTITVNYQLNGEDVLSQNFTVRGEDAILELPANITVDGITYEITNRTLRLNESDTYTAPVTRQLIGGFVASRDITRNGATCDLVDNNNVAKKITEMTLTVDMAYDLNLATNTSGLTVEWSSANAAIATVDENGNVTAKSEGTTTITAVVKDAQRKVLETNEITVNVYPEGVGTRRTAIYIEEVHNTTVWCVVNADTTKAFQVKEGELIYGQFETQSKDATRTKTTAFTFLGDPDDGHALVYMKSTNSAGQYYLTHDDEGNVYDGSAAGKASESYYISGNVATKGAGWWQALALGDNATPDWEPLIEMVEWAIDKNAGRFCDGAMGFTRRQNDGNDIGSNLTFASDPLPKITKVVEGILPTTRKKAYYRTYVDGMMASVGEQVYFKIGISLDAPTHWDPDKGAPHSAITFDDAWVIDQALSELNPDGSWKSGAFLYNKDIDNADGIWDGNVDNEHKTVRDEITEKLNAPWTDEELAAGKRVLEDYYLVYTIQPEDIPKFNITNVANLDFDYASAYSTGSQVGAADDEANITVAGAAIDDLVIDFGLPVTYKSHTFRSLSDNENYSFSGLNENHLKGVYIDDVPEHQPTARYGEVDIEQQGDEYVITYTPDKILQGADTIQIFGAADNGGSKVINTVQVYPATTVFYEENVLQKDANWTTTGTGWSNGVPNQAFELLGMSVFNSDSQLMGYVSNKKFNYGYDPAYSGEGDNSAITASKPGAVAEFTFTGTGFELYADCTPDSGTVYVTVTNANGQVVKMLMINTNVKGGSTGATNAQSGDMVSLPIVSMKDLDHGSYTVNLRKIMNDGKSIAIDGVRITNTLADSSIYNIDREDNAKFFQMRDAVLNAININDYLNDNDDSNDSLYLEDIEKGASQVYAGVSADGEAPVALITGVGDVYTGVQNGTDGGNTVTPPQDLLDNGPKNEVYLWPGQTLNFRVNTYRLVQIGMKAPAGATMYELFIDGYKISEYPIASKTDMFYELNKQDSIDEGILVAIKNTGNKVLSITDLKVCHDSGVAPIMEPLSVDDFATILRVSGFYSKTEPEMKFPFKDVAADSFYYEPVAWAVKEGITVGISANHFGPNGECNRAQVVTFLWRAAGSPEPTVSDHGFVDIESGSFYEKAVQWAVEKGITAGTDATHFSPKLNCNRASVVTFLYRAFESPEVENVVNPFTDVPADAWYTDAVLWAVKEGITEGIGDGLYGVNEICNRAQIVTFLCRAYN